LFFAEGISEISHDEAVGFLLPRHYSGRTPSISKAFGWFANGNLQAVLTFGKPASNSLCEGVCGLAYSEDVYELNRLCRTENADVQLSKFVSLALKAVAKDDWIIVSYADTSMNHCGYIYQATNFIYTGMTAERTDKFTEGNKHSRHYAKDDASGLRKVRSAKHRYVYFTARSKAKRKAQRKALAYSVKPFPKNANKNYALGYVLPPNVIES